MSSVQDVFPIRWHSATWVHVEGLVIRITGVRVGFRVSQSRGFQSLESMSTETGRENSQVRGTSYGVRSIRAAEGCLFWTYITRNTFVIRR